MPSGEYADASMPYQKLRNNTGHKYQAKRGACKGCPLLEKCINVKTSKNHVRTLYAADQKYEENLSEKMREKIDRPVNREIYSRRQQIIEPVFSDIAYCKGMNRFTLRTNKKSDGAVAIILYIAD
jgi:hypothetical protein